MVVVPSYSQRKAWWWLRRACRPRACTVTDTTSGTAVLHVAGPASQELLPASPRRTCPTRVLRRFTSDGMEVADADAHVARVSFTGEPRLRALRRQRLRRRRPRGHHRGGARPRPAPRRACRRSTRCAPRWATATSATTSARRYPGLRRSRPVRRRAQGLRRQGRLGRARDGAPAGLRPARRPGADDVAHRIRADRGPPVGTRDQRAPTGTPSARPSAWRTSTRRSSPAWCLGNRVQVTVERPGDRRAGPRRARTVPRGDRRG